MLTPIPEILYIHICLAELWIYNLESKNKTNVQSVKRKKHL